MHPLLTRAWLARHVLAAVAVLGCAAAAWWQVDRAVAGNLLSYGYALLWPMFGVFAVLIWVREMRLALGREPARPEPAERPADGFGAPVLTRRVTGATAPVDVAGDPALAEYNEYLAWLAEHPTATAADYFGSRGADRADAPGDGMVGDYPRGLRR